MAGGKEVEEGKEVKEGWGGKVGSGGGKKVKGRRIKE